jgi:hypothetical protein
MLKKGEIYELHEKFREKLGAAHGYIWVYEDRHDAGTRWSAHFGTYDFILAYVANPTRDKRNIVTSTTIKGERKWGTFRSVASGHVMNMPTFAVVAKEESLMRKILRRIGCLSS